MAREAAALATEILARHDAALSAEARPRPDRDRGRRGRRERVRDAAAVSRSSRSTPRARTAATPSATTRAGCAWRSRTSSPTWSTSRRGAGSGRAGRRIFGRAPFLFPNVFAMTWMIEGLATYEETQLTAFGRGRDPDSRMVLRMAALDGRFPKEDQAIYALDAWPGGQTPYLFGEALPARSHGAVGRGHDPAARTPARDADHPVPRRPHGREGDGSRPARTMAEVGRQPGRRTRGAKRPRAAREASAPRCMLTTRGIRQGEPRFSPDGTWIAYTSGTLDALSRAAARASRRQPGPPPDAAQRRLGPRLDAGRDARSSTRSCRCTGPSRSSAT